MFYLIEIEDFMIEKRLLNYIRVWIIYIGLLFGVCQASKGMNHKTPPIKEPFKISDSGILIDFDFYIKSHEVYNFAIRFQYPKGDQGARGEIQKIIGKQDVDKYGELIDPGVITPLTISILKKNENSEISVYENTTSPALTSWTDGSFTKKIGYCDLELGHYRVIIKKSGSHGEYENIPTFFLIGMDRFKIAFDKRNFDRSKTCPQ